MPLLLTSEVLIAREGTKELTLQYTGLSEQKHHLVIKDGGGVRSIAISKELYAKIAKRP